MNIETYKQKLETELAEVEKELHDIAVLDPETNTWIAIPAPVGDDTADDNDVADRFEDFEERSEILTSLSERWIEIKDALGKIDTDEYGKCSVCGKEIEEDRLIANPASKTCKGHMEN